MIKCRHIWWYHIVHCPCNIVYNEEHLFSWLQLSHLAAIVCRSAENSAPTNSWRVIVSDINITININQKTSTRSVHASCWSNPDDKTQRGSSGSPVQELPARYPSNQFVAQRSQDWRASTTCWSWRYWSAVNLLLKSFSTGVVEVFTAWGAQCAICNW